MIVSTRNFSNRSGATLIEVVIAVGVLAVAVPLVFGALAEAGESGMSAEAETRCTWMVPACMEEIRASRDGRPQFFTPTLTGEAFPAAGDVWALAFSSDGRVVGRLPKEIYEKGTSELNGRRIYYVARIRSSATGESSAESPMLGIHISVEYPVASPAEKRRKIDFHTRMP
jgi:hypothetical protein